MHLYFIPFRPVSALAVLFLILAAFAWAGRDETRLEQSCTRFASTVACQKL